MKIECFSQYNIDTGKIELCNNKVTRYFNVMHSSRDKIIQVIAICESHYYHSFNKGSTMFIEISETEYKLWKILK